MTRATGRMRLEWARYSPEYARIEFVDEGQHDVEPEELETQFRNLIDAVLERLQGRPETRAAAETLGRAWAAVNDMDDEELEFSRAAALLGIDPFDAPDDVAAAVAAFWERTDPSVREDALAVASEDSLARVADWLNGAIERLAATPRGGDWPVLRERLQRPDGDEPWALGYALARGARGWIGIGDGPFDFTNEGRLAIPREETQPPSPRIHGLVGAETPACMTAPHGRTGTRFLLARALGDYLGRQPGTRHGLLSSLETARQAQSRAFAAEFLVPAAALRRKINGGRADVEQIDDLGNEFGVSDWGFATRSRTTNWRKSSRTDRGARAAWQSSRRPRRPAAKSSRETRSPRRERPKSQTETLPECRRLGADGCGGLGFKRYYRPHSNQRIERRKNRDACHP